ncbi:IclR helix-turn-helix domain-containing protein [Micromonospora matsumotoense]|uniref:IclR helix-turn-helix domain-containing protein n=1 Tax=Micromonospora matsumotoense TaxID=121616 RepID=A0A1C4TW00_9ACTN|nr:helix-turn-helix domain-containing protein [Micromonospora matsumotoense]SCE63584.1 IclR helix-turn-helix domain-containing protein [Micromonospora matsumotoense]
MQHNLSLTPAMQEVLDSLRELGQGNVNELAEKSGRAVSTVHKALKTFSDAGLISEVDTGADAAEGTPARWTLAEDVALDDADLTTDDLSGADVAGGEEQTDFDADLIDEDPEGNDANDDPQPGYEPDDYDDIAAAEDNADADEDEDEDEEDAADEAPAAEDADSDESEDERSTVVVVRPSRPGDRKVMTIKAVISEHGDDGATTMEIVAESGIGDATVARLLTAMEQADAARRLPGTPRRWIAGPTKASEVDPNPEPLRCPLCFQVIKGLSESPEAVAQVQPLIRQDGTLHVVTEDGTVHTVTLPKRVPTRTPGFATVGTRRTDATINADGSQPFGRGELERLTFDTLKANPGRTMTPQEIATSISSQLGGRAVSSGAVRNNCGKLGAAGRIVMVSEVPWAFQFPAPAEVDGDADQADDATDEQS